MAQSILLSIVLSTLIVLHLTTTKNIVKGSLLGFRLKKSPWQKCLDPIKNIKFPDKMSSCDTCGKLDKTVTTYSSNSDGVRFEMKAFGSVQLSDSTVVGLKTKIEWDDDNVLFTCITSVTDTRCMNKFDYIIMQLEPEINETAIYVTDELYCSWAIKISNSTFPYKLIDPPQYYISESGYQIYYNLTQTVPIAAVSYSQLPASVEPFVDGYQYKAVGSEKYLLVARLTNYSTDFLLKVNEETVDKRLVEVNLKSDISINISCNFEEGTINMSTKAYGKESRVWYLNFTRIDGDECLWSLDDTLEVDSFPAKLKETTYQLQIIENKRFVYFDEKKFRIITPTSASSSLTIAKSLLIFTLISVIFI